MDSSHPFVMRYKIYSNEEGRPCCDICVIILCFIYVHNAITQGCGVGRFFRIPTPTSDSNSSSFEKMTPTPAVLKNRLRLQHF